MNENTEIQNKHNQIIDCMASKILDALKNIENWQIDIGKPNFGWATFELKGKHLRFGIEPERKLFCFFDPHGIKLSQEKEQKVVDAATILYTQEVKEAEYKKFTSQALAIKEIFPDCVPTE